MGGGTTSLPLSFGGWKVGRHHSAEHLAASDHRRSGSFADPAWTELQRGMGLRKLLRLILIEARQRVPPLELAFSDHLSVDFFGNDSGRAFSIDFNGNTYRRNKTLNWGSQGFRAVRDRQND